jgi:hypothetical protein
MFKLPLWQGLNHKRAANGTRFFSFRTLFKQLWPICNSLFEACFGPAASFIIAPHTCFMYKPAIRHMGSFTPGGDPGRATHWRQSVFRLAPYAYS